MLQTEESSIVCVTLRLLEDTTSETGEEKDFSTGKKFKAGNTIFLLPPHATGICLILTAGLFYSHIS